MRKIIFSIIAVLALLGSGYLLFKPSSPPVPVKLAVTTSFENSGLADILLPAFTEDTGHAIHLIVVGTGQALRLGRNGDVDVLLVHAKQDEEAFVAAGHARKRHDIMYNDFIIIGPAADPAGVAGAASVAEALTIIYNARPGFISRGDDSGTHKKELALWRAAGFKPETFAGGWYRRAGASMGAALNMASASDTYVLSDRGSWLNFMNKGTLAILFEGDAALHNQYGLLITNEKTHPYMNLRGAEDFRDWLKSPKGQKLIGEYRINGERLFTPNAKADMSAD